MRAVLNLIKDEGGHMVLHQGDLDYGHDAGDWDAMITEILGADFPYFASVGDANEAYWYGADRFQAVLQARVNRISEAVCSGDLGVQSACNYKGLFFILSGAGTVPNQPDNASHIAYIRDQLSQSTAQMRICSWHKVQRLMQVEHKQDDVGWGPYEACREHGAFVATGHQHSYSRTHLLDNFETQSIADTSDTLRIEKGKSFVVVSGLGGRSIRSQDKDGPWWASIYTASQGANFGALFCTFFVAGDPTRASCYFKDIDGIVADRFDIISAVSGLVASFTADPDTGEIPLSVAFDASGSSGGDRTIVSYNWEFGDGATATGTTTAHDFTATGSYTVSLTLTDDAGRSATAIRTVTVTATAPASNQAPVASFTAFPTSGDAALVVGFDASWASDADGTIVSYDWNFDDGASGTGASVNHEFVDPGIYTVTLTVTDNEGATDTATTIIAVETTGGIDARIASSKDDAEEKASGDVSRGSSDLDLGIDGEFVGLRFVGIDIPQGAVIVAAHVQFQADEADGDPAALQIRGQAADHALTFSSSNTADISSRPMTTAVVGWSPAPWSGAGAVSADQRTPDLSAIIQEIVDRAEWSPGNALAIIIRGTGTGPRAATSHDRNAAGAPLLHVEYVQ